MAYNGSGTWITPAGQPVVTGTVIQSTTFNALVADIASTFNNTVTRDGQGVMTAPFKLQDGTVTIPGLSFNSETSTGLYRPSSGIVAVTVSGVEALRAKANGNVMIGGTTDNGFKLEVTGTAKFSGMITATGGLTGTVTGSSSLNLLLAGGTMSGPIAMGGNQITGVANIGGSANSSAYSIWGGASVLDGGYIQLTGSTYGSPNQVILGTSGASRLTVQSTGQVVISGAATSNGVLAVTDTGVAGCNIKLTGDGATTPNKFLRVNTGVFQIINSNYTTNLLNITDAGNVGVGNAVTSSYMLAVGGSGQTVANMTDAGNKGASLYLLDTASAGAGNGGALLFGGFNIATPMCGIKGYITDAANNSRGDLVFLTRRVATDTFLTETMRISAVQGAVYDAGGIEFGYRNIPRVDQSGGAAAATIRGKAQGLTSTSTYTINTGTFGGGDTFTIVNFNSGAVTIAQGAGITMRLGGTAVTGSRTLAGFGICTVWFANGAECWVSGPGVS